MPEIVTHIALAVILALFVLFIIIFIVIGIPTETRSGQDRINSKTIFGAFSADTSRLISAQCNGDDYSVVVDVRVFTEEDKSFNYTVLGEIDNKIVRGISEGENNFEYPGQRSVSLIFDIRNADNPEDYKNFIHLTLWEATTCIENYFEENDDPKFIDLLDECGQNYLSAVSFPFECDVGIATTTIPPEPIPVPTPPATPTPP